MTALPTDVLELPAGGRYQPRLDGIRAIAVTLVLLVHCVPLPADGSRVAWALRHTLSNGWLGVDLFFALSGYLITSILLRARTRPHYFRNFYARRALRIFPLYYAVLLLLWMLAPLLPFGPFEPVWPYLTYTSNLAVVFGRAEWAPLGHTWSLAIEEQFYLFYPLLVLRLRTGSLRTLLWATIALSPLVRVATNALTFPGASYFATFCRLDVLAMGALIAVEFAERRTISAAAIRKLRVAFVALAAGTAALWLTKQLDFRSVFFNLVGVSVVDGAAALFICLAAIAPPQRLDRLLRNRLALATGRISYGIYVLHVPLVLLTKAVVFPRLADTWGRTLVVAAVSIGATFAIASVSWIAFERPLLRLKERFQEPEDAPRTGYSSR